MNLIDAHLLFSRPWLVQERYKPSFTILPPHLCKKPKLELVIIVFSTVHHFKRRQAIRSTWGNLTKYPTFQLAFLLGQPPKNNPNINQRVSRESSEFKDVIQSASIVEAREETLLLKHAAMLDFLLASNCSTNVPLVMKTDDDVYVQTRQIKSFVETLKSMDNNFFCEVESEREVNRVPGSRDYVPKSVYQPPAGDEYWDVYPQHCMGPVYLFSGGIVARLLGELLQTRYMAVDDALVTGIIAEKLEIKRTSIADFLFNFPDLVKMRGKKSFLDLLESSAAFFDVPIGDVYGFFDVDMAYDEFVVEQKR